MSKVRTRFDKGLTLTPTDLSSEALNREGDLAVDEVSERLEVFVEGESRTVVTEDQSQTLENKTIDLDNNTVSNVRTSNLASGVLNTSSTLSGASDSQVPSAKAAKDYVDSKAGEIQEDVDDLVTLSGVPVNSEDLGTFTGVVIGDNKTIKDALQDLDTAVTSHTTAIMEVSEEVQDLAVLSGVPLDSTDLGTFIGTTIPDNSTIKGALQSLETGLEAHEALSSGVHGVAGAVVGTTDVQTLTNKTINGATINNPVRAGVKEDTKANLLTYAVTATNGQIVFATDEKKMYQIIDGKLSPVGGGGQSLDTVFQLISEEELSEWFTGNNVNFLGGGTLSGTFTKNTTTPIHGDASYLYTQGSGSLNDYIATPDQVVDPKFRGQTVTLYHPYSLSEGSLTFKAYDVTNSALIPVNSELETSTGITTFKTTFVIPSTCTSIRVGYQVTTLTDGSVFSFDDIQLISNAMSIVNIDTDEGKIGEVIFGAQDEAPVNFISASNVSIGSSSSSATYKGEMYRNLYNTLWKLPGLVTTAGHPFRISSAKGASAEADWAANKTIAIDFSTNEVFIRSKGATAIAGGYQGDAIRNITGSLSGPLMGSGNGSGAFSTSNSSNLYNNTGGGSGRTLSFDASDVVPTAAENRPKNVALYPYIRYAEGTPAILTPVDTFSSDTCNFRYRNAAQVNGLDGLANAQIGDYITFTYAANTNTRTQTTGTNRPTQTDADMKQNGIRIYTRAYNAASTAASPVAIAIQIGKGFKGYSLGLYGDVGKSVPGSLEFTGAVGANAQEGIRIKVYDEQTGILHIDAGNNISTTVTSAQFVFTSASGQNNGYITINASKNPALVGINIPMTAYLKDVKPSGTAGGTFTAGAWQTRTLNTLEGDTSFVTLNANQFTLPAGKYLIEASAPALGLNIPHQTKLRNITTSTDEIIGTSESPIGGASNIGQSRSFLEGEITLTSSSTFEIQHRSGVTQSTNGFGFPTSFGGPEVYTQVKITKLL